MGQILLIEDNKSFSTILHLNISKSLGRAVILKASASEATSLLELLGNIDMIITNEEIEKELTALNINNYLESNNLNIPLLVFGKNSSNYKNFVLYESTDSWKKILHTTSIILGVDISSDLMNKDEYVPIDITYFLNITTSSMGCDVYIRINKGEAGFQYIKRLHSTDHFTREDILKYMATGLKEFYILKENFSQFVNFATTQLVLKLDDENMDQNERMRLNSESYEITVDRLKNLEIDEFTIELVNESIKSIQSSLKEANALGIFLANLLSNKISYAHAHAYLTCLIMYKCLEYFEWNTPAMKHKIAYLTYFHDISLKDERLLKLHTNTELQEARLNTDDYDLVMNHANLSAQILEKCVPGHPDLAGIVKEHHGLKSGKGFTINYSTLISPLAMMFIVVEDFAAHFLKINGAPTKAQLNEIVDEISLKYTKSTYQKTIDALKDILSKK